MALWLWYTISNFTCMSRTNWWQDLLEQCWCFHEPEILASHCSLPQDFGLSGPIFSRALCLPPMVLPGLTLLIFKTLCANKSTCDLFEILNCTVGTECHSCTLLIYQRFSIRSSDNLSLIIPNNKTIDGWKCCLFKCVDEFRWILHEK